MRTSSCGGLASDWFYYCYGSFVSSSGPFPAFRVRSELHRLPQMRQAHTQGRMVYLWIYRQLASQITIPKQYAHNADLRSCGMVGIAVIAGISMNDVCDGGRGPAEEKDWPGYLRHIGHTEDTFGRLPSAQRRQHRCNYQAWAEYWRCDVCEGTIPPRFKTKCPACNTARPGNQEGF